jgi:hypothetical protein
LHFADRGFAVFLPTGKHGPVGNERQLSGIETDQANFGFGSIFDSCACFIEARIQSGASSQIAVPYDRICSSNEFH